MNIQPFHISCPLTHQVICYCKKRYSQEETDKSLKYSKLVYQMYTLKYPEYENTFGEGYIVAKSRVA